MQIKNIVFEGGGIRCVAYGGAIVALEKGGAYAQVKRLAGTSTGALTAMLLSTGFTPDETAHILADFDFALFRDKSSYLSTIAGLSATFGIYKGDALRDWLGAKLKEKGHKEKLTFKDLQKLFDANQSSYKELYVVATNLSRQQAEEFSARNTPDMQIRDAVRASMSMPFIFKSIEIKKDLYTDGSLSLNYPIQLFDHERFMDSNNKSAEATIAGVKLNPETIGFKLVDSQPIKAFSGEWNLPPVRLENFEDFVNSTMKFFLNGLNRQVLLPEDMARTISIDISGTHTTDFNLSREHVARLFDQGKSAVEAVFPPVVQAPPAPRTSAEGQDEIL